ncbi:hypothetical protein GC097_20285 [Paenibacillus sp. LMG 31457]|uniref:Uncharacterized protein n=1 Tax=Paenibacillus planticolens TaxID=2654976 RepID=A0ABX1ZQJ4_9BACL|nr:hypothetical protein [Paenibacillus planticolens]
MKQNRFNCMAATVKSRRCAHAASMCLQKPKITTVWTVPEAGVGPFSGTIHLDGHSPKFETAVPVQGHSATDR